MVVAQLPGAGDAEKKGGGEMTPTEAAKQP